MISYAPLLLVKVDWHASLLAHQFYVLFFESASASVSSLIVLSARFSFAMSMTSRMRTIVLRLLTIYVLLLLVCSFFCISRSCVIRLFVAQ